MSTFGLFVGRDIIFGFRFWTISKLNFADSLSFVFDPFLSFKLPSSFKTSCGISHSIFSLVILFVNS